METREQVFTAAGLAGSAVLTGYRQRAEANWLLRHGVPVNEIGPRLVVAAHLRQLWGGWYVLIYFPLVLGSLVFLLPLTVSNTVRWLTPGTETDPLGYPVNESFGTHVLLPACCIAVALVLAALTWWSLARIDARLARGTGLRVPSVEVMADGMVALPGDESKRHAYNLLRVLLMVVPHAWCGLVLLVLCLRTILQFLS